MGVTLLVFAIELQIFERGLERVSKSQYVKGGRKYLKKTNPFLQNLHPDSSFRTQCDKESVFK